MISSLTIQGVATYTSAATLDDLRTINYVFGANGSGKTTISRVMGNVAVYPTCAISWQPVTQLDCLVYNCDFREKNFNEAGPLKGVFTLGEQNVQLQQQISAKQGELERKTKEIETLSRTLNGDESMTGKQQEHSALQTEFAEICWQQKVKHDDEFKQAFEGFRNDKIKFRDKVLQEIKTNTATPLPVDEIRTKAKTVFGPSPTREGEFTMLSYGSLQDCESSAILAQVVVGSTDVDIGGLIKSLGNVDWVSTGRKYFDASDPKCPFCQQLAPSDLRSKLNSFFDKTYEDDCNAIAALLAKYVAESSLLKAAVQVLVDRNSARIDTETLRAHQQTLHAVLSDNIQHLETKKREPSTRIVLKPIKAACDSINRMLAIANTAIQKHNVMVANLSGERKTLISQVWRYLLDAELKTELANYQRKKTNLDSAIQSLDGKIKSAIDERATIKDELAHLERQTTSVKPTMDLINKLLASFGFTTFRLVESASAGSYALVRGDGTPVHNTLSDGERTFLTFLYFYHLIHGSESSSGTTASRVIVFDDPISSLDSDVLFVVSSLVRNIFNLARDPASHVKQVFIMTHNVYFHKEITFDSRRSADGPMSDESFWIVRRKGSDSTVERCATNPVKSSYELLWAEVRNPSPSSLTICNALRRILENYFKLLGGHDLHSLYEKFDGEEKTICRSLVSWINDGSHFAMEDLHLSQSDDVVPKYLEVFRKVFETQNHEAHYRMMMGNAFVERPAQAD